MNGTVTRITALSLLALACSACDGAHDSKTEKTFIKALSDHKSDQVMSVDLNTLLPKGWSKLCVQTPYMMPEVLETAAGVKIKNFKMISDESSVILWVFTPKNDPSYITIPRGTVMDFRSPNTDHKICTDPQLPELNLTYIQETKYFYFN